MKPPFYLLIYFLLLPVFVQAQDSIAVRVRPTQNTIMLRWTPASARVWDAGNSVGYQITRINQSSGVRTVLNSGNAVKPAPLNDWLPYVDTTGRDPERDSTYHAVIASLIYADRVPTANRIPDTTKQHISSDALRYRYQYALLAADMKYSAARMAGLGFIDVTADPSVQYRYEVKLAPEASFTAIGLSGRVQQNVSVTLPGLKAPKAKFLNRRVEMEWRVDSLGQTYMAYWVERSATGGSTYKRLNKLPLMQTDTNRITSRNLYYIDTDADLKNRQTYFFRVVGKTLFDEQTFSLPVSGQCRDQPEYSPRIKNAELKTPRSISIDWEFIPPQETDMAQATRYSVQKYIVSESDSAQGRFRSALVLSDTSKRNAIISYTTDLSRSRYYRVSAITIDGDTLHSYPALVQPVDSIAPKPPVLISAQLTKTGQVSLTWKLDPTDTHQDADIRGYKLFRANTANEEASPVFDTLYAGKTLTYQDLLVLKMTNKSVFFRLLVVDKNYNYSKLSAAFELKKPDVIPPLGATFKTYNIRNTGVDLRWANSSDDDVAKTYLYRKSLRSSDTTWVTIKTITNPQDTSHLDASVAAQQLYAYMLMVEDASGLRTYSSPLVLETPSSINANAGINSFTAKANRVYQRVELTWDHTSTSVQEYQLYRAESANPLTAWQVASGNERVFQDPGTKALTAYKYMIRAVYNDGSRSDWKDASVTFPDECNDKLIITNASVVEPSSTVLDKACESIRLKPGFWVKPGASYKAVLSNP